jgi:ABC-type phosphate transport system substrate-binding protein
MGWRPLPCFSSDVSVRIIVAGILVLLWAAAPSTQRPAFVVIVNKANPVRSLTLVELRRIFMKQSRMWPHAEAMVPVDWESASEIRQAFSQQVLNRSVREMAEYWVQQSMTQGITPPSTQRSARAVLRFVASVPGAVSYVPAADLDNTVNTVKVNGLR